MKLFVCLLDLQGRGIAEAVRRVYEVVPRAHGLRFKWQSFGYATVLTACDEAHGDAPLARFGNNVAVGTVRLDNRVDLERWSGCSGQNLGDLELVLRTVAQCGTMYIPRILGDFAFVAWNGATGRAAAASDALMVKHLYYAKRQGLLAFASRAEALAVDDKYEMQYLAEIVGCCKPSPELSVYDGVHPVPAGTMVLLEGGKLRTQQYWSPDDFDEEPRWAKSEQEAASTCRELLIESVRLRLSGNGDTWAQLSGGLDSSSIASVAQTLAEAGTVAHGLAGTVTYVDRQGTAADEREYSGPIVRKWRLRNEVIVDPPLWVDGDQESPPRLDRPGVGLPFYPRERQLTTIVRAAGGRVLLTGVGGDELLTGTMLFFADWLARGQIRPALREMTRRAAMGRVSFWELAYRNALVPLLPPAVQHRFVRDDVQVPPWVPRAMVRRYRLQARAVTASTYAGRFGHKYHHAIVSNLKGIGMAMAYEVIERALDVRHPFLYRPLVEFALRLPPELCARPQARKWVLREAMRGILPDGVRTRIGKGDSTERYAWSLAAQRSLLEPLVREPILADLGVLDAAKFRTAFDAAPREPHRRDYLHANLQGVLSIEAWLQLRAGRWPRGPSQQ